MKICTREQILRVVTFFILLLSAVAFGQTDIVKSDQISSPLHRANVGKIVFTNKPVAVPIESLSEADFLKSFELGETGDLTMKAFLGNSLTNYLHRLAPELSADELAAKGNYQVSLFVDGALVSQENLNPWWISAERKNTETIFGATLINSADPASRWGAIWHILQLNGGAQALTAGNHLIKIELRPYVKTADLRVGELIASGELRLTVMEPKVDEKLVAIQPIETGSGWRVSKDTYDQDRIRELNRAIAESLYKDIQSIVVIKNGELLVEEYFNGADRNTLHNTRSVGKSFASTMMGIAINDGHIKSENQTLKDFYDLRKFENYSARKETVTLKSLLTMSSGFDGNDDDENSPGNEEKMYPTDNYVQFALNVPMDNKTAVGEKWRYFTAGVVVLGDVMNKSVPGGLEKYAHEKLFRPLGINKYEWQHTPQRIPLTAGGLQMSALDFAKYGQLYKNGGRWNGKQILAQSWVNKTFTKYLNVPYGPDVFYGYLFWNTTFKIGDKSYEAFFASGNGGNKIFVFKDQPLVIVVTATAFGRWYMHPQVDSIMTKYVLPAVIK